jgi:hypothetical protein
VGTGLLLARLLPQKPRQQNLRCASKISDAPAKSLCNPNDFDMPCKKMRKNVVAKLVGNVLNM